MDAIVAVKSAQHRADLTGLPHLVVILPGGQIAVMQDGPIYGGARVAERCFPDEPVRGDSR